MSVDDAMGFWHIVDLHSWVGFRIHVGQYSWNQGTVWECSFFSALSHSHSSPALIFFGWPHAEAEDFWTRKVTNYYLESQFVPQKMGTSACFYGVMSHFLRYFGSRYINLKFQLLGFSGKKRAVSKVPTQNFRLSKWINKDISLELLKSAKIQHVSRRISRLWLHSCPLLR